MSLKSPLCYPGGKSRLVPVLLKNIPPHDKYVEPFVGGGSLFFAKSPSKKDVISDKDKRLISFYRQFKNYPKGQFLRCDFTPNKEKFENLKNKKKLTPCEFLYINKHSYGCKGKTYSNKQRCQRNRKRCQTESIDRNIEKIQKRLKQAKIENKDFRKVIKEQDGKKTFMYVDPPYYKTVAKHYTAYGGDNVHPKEVCDALRKVKGKFVLSYNDHPEVKKHCKGFKFRKVKTRYTVNRNAKNIKDQKVTELLISNF